MTPLQIEIVAIVAGVLLVGVLIWLAIEVRALRMVLGGAVTAVPRLRGVPALRGPHPIVWHG